MKYKIIPIETIKNLIEFLDEIQFDAAKTQSPEDMQKINFCNWMISELMNGLDGFDSEDEASEGLANDGDLGLDSNNKIVKVLELMLKMTITD